MMTIHAVGVTLRRARCRLALITCAAAALVPQAAWAYSITGTYYNSGTWNDSLYIMTTGRFINLDGGVVDSSGVTNAGILENRLSGIILNRTRLMNAVVDGRQVLYNWGTIDSTGTALLDNYGTLYNYAGATLQTAAGVKTTNFGHINNAGSYSNRGSYEQTWANVTGAPARKLVNSGTLGNTGSMSIGINTALENSGTFSNAGSLGSLTLNLSNSGTWINSGTLQVTGSTASGTSGAARFTNTGSLTNTGAVTNFDGTLRNYGQWVNDGTVSNTTSNYIGDWGRFTNYAGASLVNHGTFSTNHVLDNAGSITNTGTLSASYRLNNLAGGTLTSAAGAAIQGATYNHGTLDNQGSIAFVDNHGVFNNLAGASQHNSVLINRCLLYTSRCV